MCVANYLLGLVNDSCGGMAKQLAFCLVVLFVWALPGWAQDVSIEVIDGSHVVRVDDEHFTTVRMGPGGRKPILFPVYAPEQVPMTRSFPMIKGVAGEATDHPHHQSVWFAHGDINGVDFWHAGPQAGRIRVDSAEVVEADGVPAVVMNCTGTTADGRPVMKQAMRFGFGADAAGRWVDVAVTLSPLPGEQLVFGETKEGLMGIRTHPSLRVANDPKHGVTTANGQLRNSEGVIGRAVWGKSARWLQVAGEVEGKAVRILFLAHPDNVRHPSRWHARHYGLLAANPFGGHDFDKALSVGSGRLALAVGQRLAFRYRLVFYKDDHPSLVTAGATNHLEMLLERYLSGWNQ